MKFVFLLVLDLLAARSNSQLNSSLVGIGMTPEGINQNEINFEVLNELGWWRNNFNFEAWTLEYIERRYGTTNSQFQGNLK